MKTLSPAPLRRARGTVRAAPKRNRAPSSASSLVPIQTEDGRFWARFTEAGLAALHFPDAPRPSVAAPLARSANPVWVRQTIRALRQALAGRPADDLPPLDSGAATDFQRRVWVRMRRIPPGGAMSYGELAAAIGRPNAARAVGQACGANPIPILTPCHRVLGARGRLGGFSSGLEWKRKLLAREGAHVSSLH